MVEALLEVDDGALAEQFCAQGNSALLAAAAAGQLGTVKILLKFDRGRLALQKNTFDGRNALMMAAERGQSDCVKLLLAWNGGRLAAPEELSKSGENALIFAAKQGHADIVRILLGFNGGMQAEVVTRHGQTAMSLAAEYNKPDVVQALLGWRQGGLALKADHEGYTPLLLAAREGHAIVLAVLLQAPMADTLLKCCLKDGRHALALAAENGHVALVKLLLSHSIDPRKPTQSGENALMLAARNGHIEVVRTLLAVDGGALMRQQSKAGETALSLANANGHAQVHELLRRHALSMSQQTVKAQAVTGSRNPMPEQRSDPVAVAVSAPRRNPPGADALLLAMQAKDFEIVKTLLSQSAFEKTFGYQNKDGDDPVRMALQVLRMDGMKALLDKLPWSCLTADDAGSPMIVIAVENRDAAMLQLMLDRIPVRETDFNLLKAVRRGVQVALQGGDCACLVLLLERAQAFLQTRAFARMLAGLQRPPADDAHSAALAIIDGKRAELDAMLASDATQ